MFLTSNGQFSAKALCHTNIKLVLGAYCCTRTNKIVSSYSVKHSTKYVFLFLKSDINMKYLCSFLSRIKYPKNIIERAVILVTELPQYVINLIYVDLRQNQNGAHLCSICFYNIRDKKVRKEIFVNKICITFQTDSVLVWKACLEPWFSRILVSGNQILSSQNLLTNIQSQVGRLGSDF